MLPALFAGLADYPLSAVAEAVKMHCRREKFFPMLADIVSRVEGSDDDRSVIAWALVKKAVEHYGYPASVRFPHLAFHYAINAMGGWVSFCEYLTAENERFQQRNFERLFRAALKYPEEARNTREWLPGYDELHNGRWGGRWELKIYDVLTGEQVSPPALEAPKGDGRSAALLKSLAAKMTAEAQNA